MVIDLRQAIDALTDTIDLVGVDDLQHGKRVGFMAAICGEAFAPFRPMAPIIRYHHTPWTELPTDSLPPREARFANLIFLVDRVDVATVAHLGQDLLYVKDDIREGIKGYRGTWFAPELMDAFLEVSNSEAFWMTLEQPHLERYLRERERGSAPVSFGLDELKRLAGIFAEIVDAKSRFTAEHSWRVAGLARYLAEQMGLALERCDKVEIAGLLHDLGKLRVPDEILEMPGKLDAMSRSVMLHHSFETYQILSRIDGLGDIAVWAAYHHEAPNGNGYPFHRKGRDLPLEARIIAVADVLQALSQDRPYRTGMTPEEALGILEDMARAGRLDADIVSLVAQQPGACWECATGAA